MPSNKVLKKLFLFAATAALFAAGSAVQAQVNAQSSIQAGSSGGGGGGGGAVACPSLGLSEACVVEDFLGGEGTIGSFAGNGGDTTVIQGIGQLGWTFDNLTNTGPDVPFDTPGDFLPTFGYVNLVNAFGPTEDTGTLDNHPGLLAMHTGETVEEGGAFLTLCGERTINPLYAPHQDRQSSSCFGIGESGAWHGRFILSINRINTVEEPQQVQFFWGYCINGFSNDCQPGQVGDRLVAGISTDNGGGGLVTHWQTMCRGVLTETSILVDTDFHQWEVYTKTSPTDLGISLDGVEIGTCDASGISPNTIGPALTIGSGKENTDNIIYFDRYDWIITGLDRGTGGSSGGGGVPGGTTCELQYQVNNTTFGGVPGSCWNGSTLEIPAGSTMDGGGILTDQNTNGFPSCASDCTLVNNNSLTPPTALKAYATLPSLIRPCEMPIGDPGAASSVLADDNDSPFECGNVSGATFTITAVECQYLPSGGTAPTVTPIITGGAGTSILTGALTCGDGSFAAGTLNGTPTQTNGQSIDGNITVAGGTAKYLVIRITRKLPDPS